MIMANDKSSVRKDAKSNPDGRNGEKLEALLNENPRCVTNHGVPPPAHLSENYETDYNRLINRIVYGQNTDHRRKLTIEELLNRKEVMANPYFVPKEGDIVLNPSLAYSPRHCVEFIGGEESLESDLSKRYAIEIDTGLNEALEPVIQKIKKEVGTESGVYALTRAMQAFNSAIPRNKRTINKSKALGDRAFGKIVPLSEFADKRLGRCLERSLLFYETLEQLSIGRNPRIVLGTVVSPLDKRDPDLPNHAWVEVEMDSTSYVADVSKCFRPHSQAASYGFVEKQINGEVYKPYNSKMYTLVYTLFRSLGELGRHVYEPFHKSEFSGLHDLYALFRQA